MIKQIFLELIQQQIPGSDLYMMAFSLDSRSLDSGSGCQLKISNVITSDVVTIGPVLTSTCLLLFVTLKKM